MQTAHAAQNQKNKQPNHLLIFVFISITQGGVSKMILVQFMSENVLLMYSFKSFKVSSLTFRSSIHLKFIFVYGIKGASLAAQWLKKKSSCQ